MLISIITISFTAVYSLRRTSRISAELELQTIATFLLTEHEKVFGSGQDQTLVLSEGAPHIKAPHSSYSFKTLAWCCDKAIIGPPSEPTHTITDPISFPSHRITLFSEGNATGGALYLIHRPSQTVYAVTIPVLSFVTVRIYQWLPTNSWQLRSIIY